MIVVHLADILDESANDVTSGVIFTDQEATAPFATTRVQSTSKLSRPLPNDLGKMASVTAVLTSGNVVVLVLVVPPVNSGLGRRVANCNVFAVGSAAVGKIALLLVEIVRSKVSKGGVPGHGAGVVLGTIVVVGVQALRGERREIRLRTGSAAWRRT